MRLRASGAPCAQSTRGQVQCAADVTLLVCRASHKHGTEQASSSRMPTQRLEAAMRPPRAVHLLLVAAVFYLRLVATQSTCCERALVERCLRASFVLEVSPVSHKRKDALRFPKNDTVRLRVHASLKGQLDRSSIFLMRGGYTDEAERQIQRNAKWIVFVRESVFGSPIFTTDGPLLLSTTDNEKQVQAAIRCGRFVPIVKQMRTAKKVRVKKRLILKCQVAVSGKFPLNITWYRKGRPVKRNSRIVIRLKSKRSQLRVDSVRMDDGGEYECRAENKCGTASATTRVIIRKGKSTSTTQTPRDLSEGLPCEINDFCLHGGTCTYYSTLGEFACRCADGYKGQRCEIKDLGNLARQGKGCDDERGMLGGCSSQTLDVDTS